MTLAEGVVEFHNLKADARNGEAFGLDIVINAEQFNYGTREAKSGGKLFDFKIILFH